MANYIIQNNPHSTTHMKLHKLIYYVYAKYLVKHYPKPLFNIPMQAWLYEPVFPDLYKQFKKFTYLPINEFSSKGNINKLDCNNELKQIVDVIISLYGNKSGQELSNLTHKESPWIKAYHESVDWNLNIIENQIIYKYFRNNLTKIEINK